MIRTRKSLALFSGLALFGSALTAPAAVAAGMEDTSFVSLVPNSGKNYAVFADADQTFSLKSNQASSVQGSGKPVKFLVEDGDSKVEPSVYTNDAELVTLAAGATFATAETTNTLTITDSAAAAKLATGDIIMFDVDLLGTVDGSGTDNDKILADDTRYEVTVSSNDISFVVATADFDMDLSDDGATTDDDLTGKDILDDNGTGAAEAQFKILREARDATTGHFVVDTDDATNTADKVLELVNVDTANVTHSVDVTAWVDDNDNNEIDGTEYTSPTRTITFAKSSTIVPTLTWNPILVGDDKMSATVTLEPAINWSQVTQADFEVDFERQGSTDVEGTDDSVTGITESWDTTDLEWTVEATLKQASDNTPWTGIAVPSQLTEAGIASVAKDGKVVTITTDSAHGIKLNDRITVTAVDDDDTAVNSYDESIFAATSARVTAASTKSFTYSVASDTTDVAKTTDVPDGTQDFHFDVDTDKQGYAQAGTFKATVRVGTTPAKIGSTFTYTSQAAVASSVTNVASANDNVSSTFKVREDYTGAVVVTTEVEDADEAAVPAGTPVKIAVTETASGAVTVNGTTVSGTKTLDAVTDANGEVTITVTNASAANTETVQLAVTSQGNTDTDTLTWETASFSVTDKVDVKSTQVLERSMPAEGSLNFEIEVRDQFGVYLTGDARLKIDLGGTRWSATEYQSLTSGKATVVVEDSPVDISDTAAEITLTLQQKNTAGSWGNSNGTAPRVAVASGGTEINGDAIAVNIQGSDDAEVILNADAVSSADLKALVATKVTAASDVRLGQAAVTFSSKVDEAVNITGNVVNSVSENGQQYDGSLITVSGPSTVLFRVGHESAFGSLTFVGGGSNDGAFSIEAFSNTSQKDATITVSAYGVSSTVDIEFEATDNSTGETLTVVAPAYVAPGSTATVKATLVDSFGNGLDTAAGDMRVTYTGAGLTVGTLPTETDADGNLTFSVLYGVNDSGPAVVVVSFDQNDDGDFTDSTDLSVSKTITIGEEPAAQKVNAGSFKGYVAVYAKGYEGQRLSAKIGNDWVIVDPIVNNQSDDLHRTTDFTGAGVDIAVRIYIDRVLMDTINLTTK